MSKEINKIKLAERYHKQCLRTVRRNLKRLKHISTGPCPKCKDCIDLVPCDNPDDPSDGWFDSVNEPHFSWSACDICERQLGGDRYPAHGLKKKELVLASLTRATMKSFILLEVLQNKNIKNI